MTTTPEETTESSQPPTTTTSPASMIAASEEAASSEAPTTTSPPTTTPPTTEAASPEGSSQQPEATTTSSPIIQSNEEDSGTTAASSADSEPDQLQTNQKKRSAFKSGVDDNLTGSADPTESKKVLLTAELIEKLMENEQVVGMMTKQLERSIGKENLNEEQKQSIVREVFDTMMNKSIELSSQNIQKAVGVVASSYKKRAVKQDLTSKRKANNVASQVAGRSTRLDTKGFGRRSTSAAHDETKPAKSSDAASKRRAEPNNGRAELAKQKRASGATQTRLDSSGNPIVVVLLPRQKA